MMSEMIKRPVQVYIMPLADGVEVLHPQNAIIKFEGSLSVDVGIICYLKRTFEVTYKRGQVRKVEPASLCLDRVPIVRRLIEFASLSAASSGRRGPTLHSYFNRLMVFVHWSDANGAGNVLINKNTARKSFKSYIAHLRDRFSRNQIGQNAVAKQMSDVAKILGEFFDDDKFSRGLNLIRRDQNTENSTSPPDTSKQSRTLALCEAIFLGISDLVIDGRQYPYALGVPSYLGFPGDRLWLFPSQGWFRTPKMLETMSASAGYNYADGLLVSDAQLKREYTTSGHRWQDVKASAADHISEANKNTAASIRIMMASTALNAYVITFLAETGMTWAELRRLHWSSNYSVEPSRQGFRTVKWRADGKEGSFELPISAVPNFRKYLELREFLLQGKGFEHLFFRKRFASSVPSAYSPVIGATYVFLRKIDPEITPITARGWRAAKSDWLVRNTDPSTAAMILQNSEKTVLRHYAEGSETLHHEEIGLFLSKVSSAVLAVGENTESTVIRPLGVCVEYGEPSPITLKNAVEPDCNSAEGCLFCENFKVHADEDDTRKLLSCRYVINMMYPSSGSHEDFELLLGPILKKSTKFWQRLLNKKPRWLCALLKRWRSWASYQVTGQTRRKCCWR